MTAPPPDTTLELIASSSLFNEAASRHGKDPLDTTAVRRSTRSNKYDSFKVHQITDVKQNRSRVKARVAPSVQAISMAAAPVQASTEECPPPTSIQDLQQVGIRCGIAPNDLSEDKLLAAQQTASSEAVCWAANSLSSERSSGAIPH